MIGFYSAGRGAPVVVGGVVIVTLFRGVDDAVPTSGSQSGIIDASLVVWGKR